jgi:hypothetical protein
MMKMILSLLLIIPLGLLFSSCKAAPRPEPTQWPESMKGYELYSWQEGDQWRFSLLAGTNREKTIDEIKSPSAVLLDMYAVIAVLEKVPSGQYVTWSSREALPFPPDSIIGQIEKACKDQGLIFNIAK